MLVLEFIQVVLSEFRPFVIGEVISARGHGNFSFIKQGLHQNVALLSLYRTIEYQLHVSCIRNNLVVAEVCVQLVQIVYLGIAVAKLQQTGYWQHDAVVAEAQ